MNYLCLANTGERDPKHIGFHELSAQRECRRNAITTDLTLRVSQDINPERTEALATTEEKHIVKVQCNLNLNKYSNKTQVKQCLSSTSA